MSRIFSRTILQLIVFCFIWGWPLGGWSGESLTLTIEEALVMVLEHNRSLVVERLNPMVQKTYVEQEQSAFDPLVQGSVSIERADGERQTTTGLQDVTTETSKAGISLQKLFSTGTVAELSIDSQTTDSSLYPDPLNQTTVGLSINQPLLRGMGRQTQLVRLQQARIETDMSQYELRGFSENLVAQVENAYWDYGLARRQIEIVEESLKLAEQQLSETQEMIAVGVTAESELAAGQAEVAAQRQGLINARSALGSSRLRLLRLLNPPGEPFWDRDIVLVHQPQLPEASLHSVEQHVERALKMRPEMNQAKLELQLGELELVRTKNGLLPRLDAFIFLEKSAYAQSFSDAVSYRDDDGYRVMGGLTFSYPLKNRNAAAQYQRAGLRQEQATKALENLKQLVALDVRMAYLEVGRSREQIDASQSTRELQEEKLRIETEKFRVGRSTALLVSQVQHDFLVSRINEVQAVINYLHALTSFYRLEGSLLERRGIAAPGQDPVQP